MREGGNGGGNVGGGAGGLGMADGGSRSTTTEE
jgi:hypothetical protein